MTEHNRQFDDLERHVSDRFRKDLRALYRADRLGAAAGR